jgi:Domain of unknown function (DUF4159)/Aerotolerance regulator N-terminal
MLGFGFLAFTQPWLLAAAVILPGLWLLLRITPPAPRRQGFPALRLLLRLDNREETPARTPLWLLLLRLAIAALIILALAGPLLNPQPRLAGSGPLLLVVDDGWSAAARWPDRLAQLDGLLAQADREGRPVEILKTAPDPAGRTALERTAAGAAREALPGWQPRPWPVDRAAALTPLAEHPGGASIVWVSDGVSLSDADAAAAAALAMRLEEIGSLRVFTAATADLAPVLLPPNLGEDGLRVAALRPAAGHEEAREVRAIGPEGQVLGRSNLVFAADAREAAAGFDLPLDLRNRVARLELQPGIGIGGVVLLDERWRRRTVGMVGQQHTVQDQPLLSEIYFLQRALAPFATVRSGAVEQLLDAPLSLLVLPDTGHISEAERQRLEAWIGQGGVLLRFAGPRLAAATDDPLVPVPLRAGDRQLGGVLSWSEPLPIGRFNPDGPFAGLEPTDEARVTRQVLAEPGPGLSAATFASLADGTPLVTGRRVGEGWLLLVHTSANTSWSSLPLSGLFVDMMRRVLALAPGAGTAPGGALELDALLAADGTLHDAPTGLAPVPAIRFGTIQPAPAHPPGLYAPVGAADGDAQVARLALNIQASIERLEALGQADFGVAPETFSSGREIDMAPWLLLAALLLALIDLLISYGLRGVLPRFGTATTALLLALFAPSPPAQAQADDQQQSLEAAVETRLAFVVTGLAEVDELSRAGLEGLGRVLAMRTSVETGDPIGVDLESDELAVYPLLYWPVSPEHPDLPADSGERIEAYLRQGGMILFDTRDAGLLLPGQGGGGPGERRMAELLRGLDLPPLVHVPADHVLTRSFYLLQEFPGRWTGKPVWVDQVPQSLNDGVSSLIIGGHDWAGAWATDTYGQSLLPVVPGGEAQREMARRFGINLVMYALTGNYKTDQVHVPALLERLGQ